MFTDLAMMEEKDCKDLSSLPKKKLQDLCKKCGLSPYRTKTNLANSLFFFIQKKNLTLKNLMESLIVGSVASIPLEKGAHPVNEVHTSKERDAHINCAVEKDNVVNCPRTLKCDEEGRLFGAEKCNKAAGFKIIQGSKFPINAGENSTFTCKGGEALGSQNALGCQRNCSDSRVDSASTVHDKDDISSAAEVGETTATQIRTRNVIHGLHLAGNTSSSPVKSSKIIAPFEFHVSLENGINLIVDLDANPLERPKRPEIEICNCYFAHKDNKFRSFRQELELLGNSSEQINRVSLRKTDCGKPMDCDHAQADSINRECDLIEVSHPCGADWSLRYSSKNPCNDVMKICEGIERTVPSELSITKSPDVKSCTSSNGTVDCITKGPKNVGPLDHQFSVIGVSQAHPETSPNGLPIDMQFSGIVCLQRIASYSASRRNVLHHAVDPVLNLEKGFNESADSSTDVCAEGKESVKVISGAEISTTFHLNKSSKKVPVVTGGVKRKRPSSEHNIRILRRSNRLNDRVIPRRSMRLIRA